MLYLRNTWSLNLRAIESCVCSIRSIESKMRFILQTVWPQIIRQHRNSGTLRDSMYSIGTILTLHRKLLPGTGRQLHRHVCGFFTEKMSALYFFRWASKLSQAPPPSGRRQSNSPTQLSSSAPSGGTVSCRWVAAPVVPVPLFQPGRTATVVPVPLFQAGGNWAPWAAKAEPVPQLTSELVL